MKDVKFYKNVKNNNDEYTIFIFCLQITKCFRIRCLNFDVYRFLVFEVWLDIFYLYKILYGQKLREYILNKIINKLLTYKFKDGKI